MSCDPPPHPPSVFTEPLSRDHHVIIVNYYKQSSIYELDTVVLKDKNIFAYAMGDEPHVKYEDVCLAQFLEENLQKIPQGAEKSYA